MAVGLPSSAGNWEMPGSHYRNSGVFDCTIMFKWLFKTGGKADAGSSARQLPRPPGAGNGDAASARPQTIDIALKHHQAGRLTEADAAYREVLAADPDHVDALHLSGLIAYQT